jgi:hypothetical protein
MDYKMLSLTTLFSIARRAANFAQVELGSRPKGCKRVLIEREIFNVNEEGNKYGC